jgi:hypothetical protein
VEVQALEAAELPEPAEVRISKTGLVSKMESGLVAVESS